VGTRTIRSPISTSWISCRGACSPRSMPARDSRTTPAAESESLEEIIVHGDELPFCSIVVPTHARPAQLRECLAALAELDYPREQLEVIVVDDGGGIPLEPVLEPFRDRIELTLLSQHQAGPGAARNTGVERAGGELLAFTDDDCRPERDWLRRLAKRYIAEPERGFGGRTINVLMENPFSSANQLLIDAGYAHNNRDPNDARFFTTNNLVLPKKIFEEVGRFDASFITSEDREFCDRWIASGFRLTYVPEAVVFHAHRLDLASFWRQQFAYGQGEFRFHSAHARRREQPVRVDASFPVTLLRVFLRQRGGLIHRLRLLAALNVWNVAHSVGFLAAWRDSRRGYARLPGKRPL